MTADPAWRGRATALKGRLSERRALDRRVEAVRGGESRSLVVHGDPGVGKTVLLDYLAGQAAGAGCRVAKLGHDRSPAVRQARLDRLPGRLPA